MRRHHIAPPAQAPAPPVTVVHYKVPKFQWLWPWLLCIGLLPLAAILHFLWGRDPGIRTVVAAVGITLCTVGLAAYTWVAGRARGPVLRGHAVVSIAVAGAWLLLAMLNPLASSPTFDLWVMLLLVGGISWNVRRGLRGHGDDGTGRGWDDIAARVKLAKSRVFDIHQSGATVRATIETDRGVQSAKDVGKAADSITSQFGIPTTGFRSVEDPNDGALARVTLVTKDLLSQPTMWSGPSAPGASIAEPLILGVRENGEPLQLWLPSAPKLQRPTVNVVIAGMTQSGKSSMARIFGVEVLSRPDATLDIVNQVKGAQFLRPFVGHERVRIHRDPQEVQRALQDLLSRIEDRAEHLGQRYLDGWQPGCGLAYEVWLIEEMAAAIANSRTFVRITQQCASAGISVAASGQRVTGDNIPTDARKQLAAAFQFGCRKEGRDQDYAISEAVIKAGARPDVWGNSRPGYCYAEIPGTDPDLWPAPARTFMADAQDIHNALHAPEKLHEKLAEIGASNQARTAFLTRVHELKADDVKVIRPADFNAVRDRYDRSASWVTMMLKALVKDGVLDELAHGMYMWHAREKVGAR